VTKQQIPCPRFTMACHAAAAELQQPRSIALGACDAGQHADSSRQAPRLTACSSPVLKLLQMPICTQTHCTLVSAIKQIKNTHYTSRPMRHAHHLHIIFYRHVHRYISLRINQPSAAHTLYSVSRGKLGIHQRRMHLTRPITLQVVVTAAHMSSSSSPWSLHQAMQPSRASLCV